MKEKEKKLNNLKTNALDYERVYLKGEISALKKGIEACEEALEQRNKEIIEMIDTILESKTGKYLEKDSLMKTFFSDTVRYRKDLIMKEIKQQLTKEETK